MSESKKCGYCGKVRRLSKFHKNSSGSKDGLRSYCCDCANLKMRLYRRNGTTNKGDLEEMTIGQLNSLKHEVVAALYQRGLNG